MPASIFRRFVWRALALTVLVAGSFSATAQATRIKEIAAVQGVRTNQLTGYGLVVGLDGTGDQTTQMPYTSQSLANYLQQQGITLPPGTAQIQLKNVAAVIVTAQLPAFAQPGQMIDVNVSSMGNAKSLKGGLLVTTPLRRRRDLCPGPGQPGGGRRWCRCRRQQGPDQPPQRRAHSGGRPGRTLGAHAAAGRRHHQPRTQCL